MTNAAILDTILSQKHQSELQPFRAADVLQELLSKLSERERNVLIQRYGLSGGDQVTLEQIGTSLKVTRERIRQIAKLAIDKLREAAQQLEVSRHFFRTFEQILRSEGGISEVNFALRILRHLSGLADEHDPATVTRITFLLDNVAPAGQLEYRSMTSMFRARYALPNITDLQLEPAMNAMLALIDSTNNPLTTTELVQKYVNCPYWQTVGRTFFSDALAMGKDFSTMLGETTSIITDNVTPEVVRFVLNIVALMPDVQQNIFGEWGRGTWPTIHPRRMNDKIYLILKREHAPLHFTAIADKVNQAMFDRKRAKASSIHNELILDQRFVLIGRGTYALKEWGYERGTVHDVIISVMQGALRPLTRDQIVDAVLKKRQVKKQTIYLALMDKNYFVRLEDDTFTLLKL